MERIFISPNTLPQPRANLQTHTVRHHSQRLEAWQRAITGLAAAVRSRVAWFGPGIKLGGHRKIRSALPSSLSNQSNSASINPTAVLVDLHYGIQFDNTFTTISGLSGSFVFKCTPKLCGPSMPSCIMKTPDSTNVLSPDLSTIEPMVS